MIRLVLAAFVVSAFGCAPQEDRTPQAATLHIDEAFVIEAVSTEDFMERVAAVDAAYVVVNFWASWCAPCREEFPELLRLDREHDDVAVRFVSVDHEDDLAFAADFLREQRVQGTTYLQTGPQQGFLRSVSGRWTGAIPATAIYSQAGEQLAFWEGKVDYRTLVERVDEVRVRS